MSLFEDSTAPARNAVAVTPADDGDLFLAPYGYPRAIRAGVGGSIRVNMLGTSEGLTASSANGETEVDFPNVQNGETLGCRISRVWATGTTATGIVALY